MRPRLQHAGLGGYDIMVRSVTSGKEVETEKRENTTQEGKNRGGGERRRCQIFPTCDIGVSGERPKLPCLSRLNTSFHKTMSMMKVYGIAQWGRGKNYRDAGLISHSFCSFLLCRQVGPKLPVVIISGDIHLIIRDFRV